MLNLYSNALARLPPKGLQCTLGKWRKAQGMKTNGIIFSLVFWCDFVVVRCNEAQTSAILASMRGNCSLLSTLPLQLRWCFFFCAENKSACDRRYETFCPVNIEWLTAWNSQCIVFLRLCMRVACVSFMWFSQDIKNCRHKTLVTKDRKWLLLTRRPEIQKNFGLVSSRNSWRVPSIYIANSPQICRPCACTWLGIPESWPWCKLRSRSSQKTWVLWTRVTCHVGMLHRRQWGSLGVHTDEAWSCSARKETTRSPLVTRVNKHKPTPSPMGFSGNWLFALERILDICPKVNPAPSVEPIILSYETPCVVVRVQCHVSSGGGNIFLNGVRRTERRLPIQGFRIG